MSLRPQTSNLTPTASTTASLNTSSQELQKQQLHLPPLPGHLWQDHPNKLHQHNNNITPAHPHTASTSTPQHYSTIILQEPLPALLSLRALTALRALGLSMLLSLTWTRNMLSPSSCLSWGWVQPWKGPRQSHGPCLGLGPQQPNSSLSRGGSGVSTLGTPPPLK